MREKREGRGKEREEGREQKRFFFLFLFLSLFRPHQLYAPRSRLIVART